MRRTVQQVLLSLSLGLPLVAQQANLEVVSGNGQIVLEYFKTQEFMTVRARDQFSRPLVGLNVTWSVSSGQGTITDRTDITDSEGIAKAKFVGTAVPGGQSYQQSTVVAQSSVGSATFYVTAALSRLQGGGGAALPLVELYKPTLEESGRAISGTASTTLTGAIAVRVAVQSGPQSGSPIANVGVRLLNVENPSVPVGGTCRGAINGTLMTDGSGNAVCDLILGSQTGQYRFVAVVGEVNQTPEMFLTIRIPTPCTFTIQPTTKAFSSTGGFDTFSLAASAPNCTWSASSNASWLTTTGLFSGAGSANISYGVQANTGPAREGRITVGGQSFVVTQVAAGSTGVLSITSPATLPNAIISQPFTLPLQATGGRPPYRWNAGLGIPDGLFLSPDGVLSGVPTRLATFTFPAVVIDANNSTAIKDFTITVATTAQSQDLQVTNTSFPQANVGGFYSQTVTSINACPNLVIGPRYEIMSGRGILPPGLVLRQAGQQWLIDGTPTQAGAFAFTIQVTDPCNRTAQASFTLSVSGQTSPISSITPSPASLQFSVLAGGTISPLDQSIFISNASQALTYTATKDQPWILIRSGAAGTTPAFMSVGIADYLNMVPGNYSGTITISAAGVTPVTVPVNLEVRPSFSGIVGVSPASLTFNVVQSFFPVTTPERQSLRISSPTGAAIRVERRFVGGQINQQWLRLSTTSITAPDTVEAIVDQQSLAPGQYQAEILLTPAGAAGPTAVPVFLTVTNTPQFNWTNTGVSFNVSAQDPLPAAQTITLTTTSAPIRVNITAPTSTGGNWLRVTPNTGTTPVSLSVSVDPTGLTAGSYRGEILARPADTVPGLQPSSIQVIMIVSDTNPTITSVTHAASGAPGPFAPGTIVAVTGSFLASTTETTQFKVTNGKVDTTLAGARFLVNGVPVPILAASSTKAFIQIPYNFADTQSSVLVAEFRGVLSNPVTIRSILINPALFVLEDTQGWVFNQNGTQNRMGNAADPGSEVDIYGTGEGLLEPAGIDGLIYGDNPPVPQQQPVKAWLDGQEAEVISYGGIAGFPAGYFHVKVKVPEGVRRGVPVNITVGINGNYTPDTVTLAISPAPNQ